MVRTMAMSPSMSVAIMPSRPKVTPMIVGTMCHAHHTARRRTNRAPLGVPYDPASNLPPVALQHSTGLTQAITAETLRTMTSQTGCTRRQASRGLVLPKPPKPTAPRAAISPSRPTNLTRLALRTKPKLRTHLLIALAVRTGLMAPGSHTAHTQVRA